MVIFNEKPISKELSNVQLFILLNQTAGMIRCFKFQLFILACSRDGTARLWDCGSGQCISLLSETGCVVNGCSLGMPAMDFGGSIHPESEFLPYCLQLQIDTVIDEIAFSHFSCWLKEPTRDEDLFSKVNYSVGSLLKM